MRISDWSSDVCSSDLGQLPQAAHTAKLLVSSLSARSGRSLSHWAPSRTRRKNARITAFVSKTFDCVPEVIWWPPLKSIFISTGLPDVVAACRRAAVLADTQKGVRASFQPWVSRTRSEERRVGKECVSTCKTRGAAY